MRYLLAPFFILFSLLSFAQQNHFIYIQAENQQPFYVKLDKKIMSSSASGYLIIPKLKEGAYDFMIGFPKSEWPEQNVTSTIKQVDAGYILKNFGDKGWGLFNFQTMDLVMAGEKPKTDTSLIKQNKDDAFANVLSTVVNDPGIKNTDDQKDEIKPEIKPAAKQAEKKALPKKAPKPIKTTKEKKAVAVNNNQIKKLQHNVNDNSTNLVYVDITNGKLDTVNVIIPAGEEIVVKPLVKQPQEPVQLVKDTVTIVPPIVSEKLFVKQPGNTGDETVVDTALKVITTVTLKVSDTVVAVVQKASDETVTPAIKEPAVTKRSKKKQRQSKPDIITTTVSEPPVITDTTANSLAQNIPQVEIVKPAPQEPVVTIDTTANVSTSITQEVALVDQAKVKSVNKRAKRKNKTPQVDIVKTTTTEPPVVVSDTTVTLQPAIKDPVVILDTAVSIAADNKTDVVIEDVVKHKKGSRRSKNKPFATETISPVSTAPSVNSDTTAMTNTVPVSIPALTAASDTPVVTTTIIVDSVLKSPVENVVPEKKPDNSIVKEKIIEPVVNTSNSSYPKMTIACKTYADDDEYLNLRKKMAKGRSDDEMLFLAHKLFIKRCFSTKQIQRLSLLFATDAGKYKLFDDAYQFTYDAENFTSLESELVDDYYKKRFRAMLH